MTAASDEKVGRPALGTMREYRRELEGIEDVWQTVLSEDGAHFGSRPFAVDITKPVVTVGSGCSLAVASLAAFAFRTRSVPAVSCTPYDAPAHVHRGTTVVLLTAGATHPDVASLLDLVAERRVKGVLITLNPSPSVADEAGRHRLSLVTPSVKVISEGFIPARAPAALAALAIRIAVGPRRARRYLKAATDARARYESEARRLKALQRVRIFHVIRDQQSEPAAVDLETRLLESGVASVTLSDPWNFGHGRYMSVRRPRPLVGALLVGGPTSRPQMQHILRSLPKSVPRYYLRSPLDGLDGCLDAWFHAMWLVDTLTEGLGVDPGRIRATTWGDRLYLGRASAPRSFEG